MTSTFLVRQATASDAEAVADVLRRSLGDSRATPSAEEVARRLDAGPVWVVIEGEEIVGTLSGEPQNDALHLRSMAILPTARGQGIGRGLLAIAEYYARQAGLRRLTLSTMPLADRALSIYEGFGFRKSGPDGEQDGATVWPMEKVLDE